MSCIDKFVSNSWSCDHESPVIKYDVLGQFKLGGSFMTEHLSFMYLMCFPYTVYMLGSFDMVCISVIFELVFSVEKS